MLIIANIAIALIALIHVYILIVEMFLWDKPVGLRAFGLTQEFATATKSLAANQGLYNGFLAAGLGWGVLSHGSSVKLFFLGCVAIAGIFGALTASKKILLIQTAPAVVAIVLVFLARGL